MSNQGKDKPPSGADANLKKPATPVPRKSAIEMAFEAAGQWLGRLLRRRR
jgi:hypothetical protein